MIARISRSLLDRLAPVILGTHPRNRICSFNYFNVRHIRRFLEGRAEAFAGSDSVVLDVGAGASPYRSIFQGKYGRYIAIDVPGSLTAGNAPGIEYVFGTAEALPVADRSVDLVLFNQVLEHVEDADRSIVELGRVLKPGGLLLGSVPHVSPVHLEDHDYRRYTDLGLRQLLEKHGFTKIEVDTSGAVYSSAALLVTMDWVLSKRQAGRPQEFRTDRAVLLSPLIGLINLAALLSELALPNSGRSPANLCWSAVRDADK
jgi:SAM-dependent methyltransferase